MPVARRNRVKPARWTTSRMRASPAGAPRVRCVRPWHGHRGARRPAGAGPAVEPVPDPARCRDRVGRRAEEGAARSFVECVRRPATRVGRRGCPAAGRSGDVTRPDLGGLGTAAERCRQGAGARGRPAVGGCEQPRVAGAAGGTGGERLAGARVPSRGGRRQVSHRSAGDSAARRDPARHPRRGGHRSAGRYARARETPDQGDRPDPVLDRRSAPRDRRRRTRNGPRRGTHQPRSAWLGTYHDLVAETVREALAPVEKARLHKLLAAAFTSGSTDTTDHGERAWHLAGAGDRPAATIAYAQGARHQIDRFADREAVQLAEAGLAMDPGGAVRAELLEVRAETRARTGRLAGARDDLRAALTSAPSAPIRARC